MRIAFYAPMKPPDHPVPSGDRQIARLLIRALRRAGHTVETASRLCSLDSAGDLARQRRIQATGECLAQRYIARNRHAPPDLWFTYHLYDRASDWLGPTVADAFGIPYLVADASDAPSRAGGPWAEGHAAARAAIQRADLLLVLDPRDRPCLEPLVVGGDQLVGFPPFIDAPACLPDRAAVRRALAHELSLDPTRPWLAAVAMMRPGAKLASYRVLAESLHRLADCPALLLIAGDGPARPEVEAIFRSDARARFLGQLAPQELARLHAAADLAVWPAVGESIGLALLEAQAAGLPVVAGDRPGVAQLMRDGRTGLLAPEGDADAFAAAVRRLLRDPAERRAMSIEARRIVLREHGIGAASARLDRLIRPLVKERMAA